MAGSYTTTSRFSLRALLGSSKVSDVDEGFLRLAEDVDSKMAGIVTDTMAKRPAAGINNRFFMATGLISEGNGLYLDNGAEWRAVLQQSGSRVAQTTVSGSTTSYSTSAYPRPTFVNLLVTSVGAEGLVSVKVGGLTMIKEVPIGRSSSDSNLALAVFAGRGDVVQVTSTTNVALAIAETYF